MKRFLLTVSVLALCMTGCMKINSEIDLQESRPEFTLDMLERKGDFYVIGDMLLSKERAESFLGIDNPQSRGAKVWDSYTWPNGIVPYEIHNANSHFASMINTAMREISDNCGVIYRQRTNEPVYLNIYCNCLENLSPVGYYNGLDNVIELSNQEKWGVVAHELMHSLGIFHEHQRSDRDNYLAVYYERTNIPNQFFKYGGDNWPNQERKLYDFGKFDFNSVMLYGSRQGAINASRPVMYKIVDGSEEEFEAQRDSLSSGDKATLKSLYGEHRPKPVISLSGPSETIEGATNTFTILGDLSVFENQITWTVSPNGIIVSGQGTKAAKVSFTGVSLSDSWVSVTVNFPLFPEFNKTFLQTIAVDPDLEPYMNVAVTGGPTAGSGQRYWNVGGSGTANLTLSSGNYDPSKILGITWGGLGTVRITTVNNYNVNFTIIGANTENPYGPPCARIGATVQYLSVTGGQKDYTKTVYMQVDPNTSQIVPSEETLYVNQQYLLTQTPHPIAERWNVLASPSYYPNGYHPADYKFLTHPGYSQTNYRNVIYFIPHKAGYYLIATDKASVELYVNP